MESRTIAYEFSASAKVMIEQPVDGLLTLLMIRVGESQQNIWALEP